MSLSLSCRLIGALVLVGSAVSLASAQTTTYNNRGLFLAAINGPSYTETFDSLPVSPTQISSPQTFSGNGFTFTASAPNGFENANSGSDVYLVVRTGNNAITFNFAPNTVNAVGGDFFTTDINGMFNNGTLSITLNDGTTVISNSTATNNFTGFTSANSISSLTVQRTPVGTTGFFPAVNNFTVGMSASAAPEPGTIALVLTAVPAIGLVARRHRK